MWHRYVVTSAACAVLLGFAYTPPVAAADLETRAVWKNLRPNLTPPFTKKKTAKTTRSQKQKKKYGAKDTGSKQR